MLEFLLLAAAKIEPMGRVGGWEIYQGTKRCTAIHSTKYGKFKYGTNFSTITLAFDPDKPNAVQVATVNTLVPTVTLFKKKHALSFGINGVDVTYDATRDDGYFWFDADRAAVMDALGKEQVLKTRYANHELHSTAGGGPELLNLIDQCVERLAKSKRPS